MKNSESKIQQECVMWMRNTHCLATSSPRCIIFSVPNEGKNVMEQMSKIQTGLMSGVSDLVVVLPGRVLFMECKDEKGTQKPKQKKFQERAELLGFEYHLFRSLKEFQEIISLFI